MPEEPPPLSITHPFTGIGVIALPGKCIVPVMKKIGLILFLAVLFQAPLLYGYSDLFYPHTTYKFGSQPWLLATPAVAVGDLNNDGRNDVALITSDSDNTLYVFLQNKFGLLDSPVKYPLISSPISMAVGDLDHDGKVDVVVTYGDLSHSLDVFLQNNNGTLDPPVAYASQNSTARVRIADLDNDGREDVITLGTTVDVFFQNASGALNPPVSLGEVTSLSRDLAVGDVNHDGLSDIVFTSGQLLQDDSLGVLVQKQDGSFDEPVYYVIPQSTSRAHSIALADINGDDLNDLVITDDGGLAIYLQNTEGTLEPPATVACPASDSAIRVDDFNLDGKQDIVLARNGYLDIYLQGLDGTFSPGESYPIPCAGSYTAQGMALGDINGDGLNDIVLTDWNNQALIALYRANPATLVLSQDYLPLVPGTTWKYLRNGEDTVRREILNKKVEVNGVETTAVKFIEEKVTEYLTSDSTGIFLHRQYEPHIFIGGVGWVNTDVTFIPPIKLAEGEVWIGQSSHSSGSAKTVVTPLGRTFFFSYTADSTIETEETITVPAGTFDAIRVRQSITLSEYGETLSMTRYLAKGIGIVKDVITDPQGETSTVALEFTNASVHDLAVTQIVAPKVVTLTSRSPSKTLPVNVKIQNRGPYPETIQDAAALDSLITLTAESLGSCANATPVLRQGKPQRSFPITLKPKALLTVFYDLTLDCPNDPAKSTARDPDHSDYRYRAVVNHTALDGTDDSDPFDDVCPRNVTPPYVLAPYPNQTIKDRGCGSKKSDGTFGGDIITDIIVR
jgi:hypothetical protein